MSDQTMPPAKPGDILNWPMLKIRYLSDTDSVAKLLPPGIQPGKEPGVTITIYNFPVLGEPEYGCVVNVDATYNDIEGEYTLGIGIDQEAAIYSSQERWGQPKFYADTQYYRLMDYVSAKVSHRGYTFLEFNGQVTGEGEKPAEFETNEWWIKHLRGVDMENPSWDFPPHVVRVYAKYGTAQVEKLQGQVKLLDSPWDPIAKHLPMRSEAEAWLWTPIFLDRRITLEGPLDAEAFWPYADTIGGSRWPGENGGPKKD
ncbi:acetoacetate decarboxylase family protein [Spongiibacter nanhainus]|uniref:Acetoacetate decarboxylase family protein n=1 Tax=Spongiibacter nanhainus TaxID=2794344 RepID=A0A7T4R2Q1_9GAMM|nr:acetoacetate decarboxylase family protein [Spongiibacter nanhainus]QQD19363.1 acetoacetate decarboxylase family protein [Spongiibacter nanhainus]